MAVEEGKELETYKKTNPDYYEGVKNGWSILFLGRDGKVVIAPGIRTRDYMVGKIKKEFWEKNSDIEFKFLDGTKVLRPKLDSKLPPPVPPD
ncbi:MAG: hypothetical protein GTO45_41570 [Candidatus Aminicenantes bacterium]|nr:hypothetical protein [Candidatus Aminicenantes bacterium]NIM85102.1 hypothetical protein [Candidatus Aminicenantes bacterium]NIN24609.1 hypothetical protein [Candidatus Aminicenantes bacterium]NIN48373.1 hypothetical protein [Candidatus Aminicenantes bacterium]NIN91276.1 hypothetical protein [Candidatus Aminicenantes bacterium]